MKQNNLGRHVTPEKIERNGESGLNIWWSDGSSREYTVYELRNGCPCATCREKKRAKELEHVTDKPKSLPILSAAELQPLKIVRMLPVGNYAYNIAFTDGHDSGIFTFDLLLQLGRSPGEKR